MTTTKKTLEERFDEAYGSFELAEKINKQSYDNCLTFILQEQIRLLEGVKEEWQNTIKDWRALPSYGATCDQEYQTRLGIVNGMQDCILTVTNKLQELKDQLNK